MGKHKPGKGKAVKKARAGALNYEEELTGCPHSFIFHQGKVSKNVQTLIKDMRHVMEPFTAPNLKVRRKNSMKDFVSAAGIYNVSHLVIFTQTETSIYMKLIRLPRGPTLTFEISSFSLSRDIISSLKDPHMDPKQFHHHPLAILNNFSGDGLEFKLMTTMWQNMFPPIHVAKVKLNNLRRCVVLNYNNDCETIDFSHCNIQVSPVGVSKPIKKLVKAKVPNMSKYSDISEFITRDGNQSESETEGDGPLFNEVTLPQEMSGRGNIQGSKSAIRVTEVGPRMTMRLLKIHEGICDKEVLYHRYITKTEEEIKMLKEANEKKKKLKEQRKRQQEENIRKKKSKESDEENDEKKASAADDDEDDDNKVYEEEVGVAPEDGIFSVKKKRKFRKDSTESNNRFVKKVKRFDKNDKRFDKNAKKFGKKDKRFDKNDKRFDKNDKRFDKKDKRFDKNVKRFGKKDKRFDKKVDRGTKGRKFKKAKYN